MIAILSDFGNSEYLGIMKGAIYSIAKDAKIVDLFNNINPHGIREGAWILLNSYKYFPKNTIFLCIVDPGVGSERQSIAIKTKNYFFIGPDNGLMFPAASEDKSLEVIRIKEGENISKTFHGRDIFAKAAAKLENKVNINQLGPKTAIKNKLGFYLKNRRGEIVRVDNFGNIITNLRHIDKDSYMVKHKNIEKTMEFYETYAKAPQNRLFLIKGSSNTLEISIRNDKASRKFNASVGDKIEIR